MSPLTASHDDLRDVLAAIDEERPPALELAERFAAARNLDFADAQDRVYTAIDNGILLEEGDGFGGIRLAEDIVDKSDESAETEPSSPEPNPGVNTGKKTSPPPESGDGWENADFTNPQPDTYPPELLECEQWMGRVKDGKLPFSPWGNSDHPDAPAEKDARYKWGLEQNYADGETVSLAEDDPRLGGRVFIQREDDPYAFVDGDDVRDPETGEVHPAFRTMLQHLGVTYADVSTSGSGVHAYYRGELPLEGKGQATFEIDTEPWGANNDPPTVEIYANKHVNVTTGEHVRHTPLTVAVWDADVLGTILEANGIEGKETPSHDTDKDRADLEEYNPDATGSEETTDEIRDVLHAVDQLEPRDLRLRTSKVGMDSTGWEKWDPSSYRTSSGGDSLHRPSGESVFHDHKHGESFGVLSLLATEEGILSNPWDRLEGSDWWDAVDAARDAGASIPEYVGSKTHDSEPVAVLPRSVRDLSHATTGWDWRHTAEHHDATLTVDEARERTVAAIADAYRSGDQILVEALPTMGKSYGAIAAAAKTDEPITVVTGRGRKEQYDQFREWCDEHDLGHYTLPSFTHDCDTANGEHGEEWAETVREWYSRGATPKEIHKSAEYVLNRPLPCQEREGETCPYASKWDFDPDDYDVLIGHYNHAHKSKVTQGRTVVFDEFPDAYETSLGPELQAAVSYWLETTDGIPFNTYTDLLEHRDDESRRADALVWFEEHGVDRAEMDVLDDPNAHADAPLAAFTLLASEDLGNGFEYAEMDDIGRGVFNRARGVVSVLQSPGLEYASGVVALDGTPTKRMWELALGSRLNHRPVLQDSERSEYIRDALNLNLVRTSEYVKPYNSAAHVNPDQDAALLEAIADEHDTQPSIITTSTAEREYDDAGILEYVDETKHYGNVLGSNEFDETRLGAVIGSNHYGDGYIKKWAAYAGEGVEREDGKGSDLSYTGFGNDVLQHMREHDTLQAAMRFGRDGNGAVVFVHTDTLPEWVPVAGEGRVTNTRSDGERGVISALEELETATTEAVVQHPAVDVSRQQVFTHLETLRQRGVLDREQDTEDGRRFVWRNDGLHRLNEHGEVELDPVEVDELDEETVRQVARNSIYTWNLTNSPAENVLDSARTDTTGASPTSGAIKGPGPPE